MICFAEKCFSLAPKTPGKNWGFEAQNTKISCKSLRCCFFSNCRKLIPNKTIDSKPIFSPKYFCQNDTHDRTNPIWKTQISSDFVDNFSKNKCLSHSDHESTTFGCGRCHFGGMRNFAFCSGDKSSIVYL